MEVIFPPLDLFEKLILIVVEERAVPSQEDVTHDTHGPNVNFTSIRVSSEDLWSHVIGCSTSVFVWSEVFYTLRESKISEFNVGIVIIALQKKVLRLNVSVNDPFVMHKFHGFEEYFNEISGFLLCIIRLADDPIEELTT